MFFNLLFKSTNLHNNKKGNKISKDFQQKKSNTFSDNYGKCGSRDCPYLEVKCSQKCFLPVYAFWSSSSYYYYAFQLFLQCFNFLFKSAKTFLITNLTSDNVLFQDLTFHFNSSFIQFIPTSCVIKKPNIKITLKYQNHKQFFLLFEDKLQNLSFIFNENDLYGTCRDNFLGCPWYFRCENCKLQLIDIKKVCDFDFDCEDQSDEKYCSNFTHFNCTKVYPVSIDRNKVNDDELDCEDYADESKENQISSV